MKKEAARSYAYRAGQSILRASAAIDGSVNKTTMKAFRDGYYGAISQVMPVGNVSSAVSSSASTLLLLGLGVLVVFVVMGKGRE